MHILSPRLWVVRHPCRRAALALTTVPTFAFCYSSNPFLVIREVVDLFFVVFPGIASFPSACCRFLSSRVTPQLPSPNHSHPKKGLSKFFGTSPMEDPNPDWTFRTKRVFFFQTTPIPPTFQHPLPFKRACVVALSLFHFLFRPRSLERLCHFNAPYGRGFFFRARFSGFCDLFFFQCPLMWSARFSVIFFLERAASTPEIPVSPFSRFVPTVRYCLP